MSETKFAILGVISGIWGVISVFWVGLGLPLQTLLAFMVIDYITGFVIAWKFKESPKTDDGGLSSNVGFKGICKKGTMLLIVYMAYRLDLLGGTNIAKNTVIAFFTMNEGLSINENAKIMGINIPEYVVDIIKNIRKDK